ncbi:hypothetical protein T07_11049 [Trichinella nelsoni]|uniref:Uncharacterized protein n=1 Tax=Trichinella nelsoni TaxID=6336 RepID=A0A0V0SJS1_9BILA|nr:hypothetical protein T07_11049 [Trichinella nelsoni]
MNSMHSQTEHLTTHNRRVITYCPDRLEMFINYSEMEKSLSKAGWKRFLQTFHFLLSYKKVILKCLDLHKIRNIDDYRFNRKCCLLFDLKCTFKKIFSNCGHCMPNTGLNHRQHLLIKHFISGTISTLQVGAKLKMELFMFKLIINIRQRVMCFVLGCYLKWTMSSSSLYEVENEELFLFLLTNADKAALLCYAVNMVNGCDYIVSLVYTFIICVLSVVS